MSTTKAWRLLLNAQQNITEALGELGTTTGTQTQHRAAATSGGRRPHRATRGNVSRMRGTQQPKAA